MTASALSNNKVLALPEPSTDASVIAKRTIIGVFNLLGARIARVTDGSVTAEIQPDVFIYARLHIYGPKSGMIHWLPVCENRTNGTEGCYLAANRPIEALARDVRRRVYSGAIIFCKAQRESRNRIRDAELVGELRRTQLETILGEPLDDRENEVINGDFSLKLSKYELQYPSSIRATITVRNWNCFLMMMKLLAEDKRLSK